MTEYSQSSINMIIAYYHYMKRTTITVDAAVLEWIDHQVASKRFRNISHAFEFAISEMMKEEINQP